MRLRTIGATLLLALVIGLAPLAYASPPDETWQSGLYDDDDYDDVVIALTSTLATFDAAPAPDLGPAAGVIETLRQSERSAPESAPRSSYRLRAPPLV